MNPELKAKLVGLGIDVMLLEKLLDMLGPIAKRIIIEVLMRLGVVEDCPAGHERACALQSAKATALTLEGCHDEALHCLLSAVHSCCHCCEDVS
jgi:hypothetical protein